MPYLPRTTVASCLAEIQAGDLVLPAIQREYVWKPAQVTALFDSLMRGYPVGSFLSWKVEPATLSQFRFYGFMRHYSELNQTHNPQLDVPSTQPVRAVLDGQQRLTSLNIGLRGTYAYKRKYGWSKFAENYPARTLHLNLAGPAAENPAGLLYDFRLLTQDQLAQMDEDERRFWLPVPLVAGAVKMQTLFKELAQRGVANDETATEFAGDLWEKVHAAQSIYFYEETDQDIERVLDIFIRVNSGGSPLSYSDLLLSIATAQWKDRDARKEIHDLVDDLNATGPGFNFNQDLILKTGLVLAGVNDISFKVKNFTAENMQLLNNMWDEISASLRVAVALLADFGLSAATLPARSVLIPVATYVHHRGLTQSYREAPKEAADRQALKTWVLTSLIVPGIWGSSLDALLRGLRDTITAHGSSAFPVAEIERDMASRGKSLAVAPALIERLLDLEYGDPTVFAVLAMLFPHVNTRNVHHIDHIFPTARLKPGKLKQAGISGDEADAIAAWRNTVANLELLEGPENVSKLDKDPASWASATYSTPDALAAHMNRHALPELPSSPDQFVRFAEARRELLKQRLTQLLASSAPTSPGSEPVIDPIEDAPESEYPVV